MLSPISRNDGISCPLASLPSAFPATPSTSGGVGGGAGGGRMTPGASAVELLRRYIESLPRPVPFRVEIRSATFWRAAWTEFVATLLLLVVGCGAEIRWNEPPCPEDHRHLPAEENNNAGIHIQEGGGAASDLRGALGFGLAVAALFHSVVHVSGCHLNPAVTATLLVTRCISPLRAAVYVFAQCVGAVLGAAILYGLTPADVRLAGLAATVPQPNVHATQAFGVEFLITLFVALTFVANMDEDRGKSCFKGPALGISYVVGHLFGYRYTGAGMNPARSLALALVTNTWTSHWVYWVGPIFGGIIGGITYEYIRNSTVEEHFRKRTPSANQVPVQQQQQPPSMRHHNIEFKRDQSGLSSQETELTCASNELRV